MPWRSAEEIWRTGGAEKGDRVRGPRRRATGGTRGHREARRAHGAVEVIDGALAHLGVPSLDEAMRFVAAAPDRAAGTAQSHYVGLTLEATSGWQLASAAVYLALAGAALAFGGGIDGDPVWRAAALHAYGQGFVVFFVFGHGEHLLPRFTGAPIRGGAIAWTQFVLTHVGTWLLVGGLAVASRPWAFAGGLVAWIAFAVFAVRMLGVLRHRPRDDASPLARSIEQST